MRVITRASYQTLVFGLFCFLVATEPSEAQVTPAAIWREQRAPQMAPPGEFVNRTFKDASGDHKYVVFVPGNYTPNKKWPVVLFLHGASTRGTDGRSQLVSGLAPSIRLRMSDYPFLVVFPQCENTNSRLLGGWTEQPEDAERALKILDSVEQEYAVDKGHECLVGLSMGGTGAWDIASRTRERWAALVVVSAMANKADAPKVVGIPTWVFHATSDPLVAPHVAKDMVTAINEAGGSAYFTEVTKRGHDLSNVVFTQEEFTKWLLNPRQKPNVDLNWTEPKGYNNGHESEVPFVPGAEMARAARLRICRDVIDAICFAAPAKFAAKPLSGDVGAIQQSKKIGGFLPVGVALSGLHYNGNIEQIKIIPKAPNRLIIQVALRNIKMRVNNSHVSSKVLLSATAGPMDIVIGHRAPVWLTVELQPFVQNRRVYLNLAGTNFQIPDDNWYVTGPSQVHVKGMPFLNSKVSHGLVDGIYTHKNQIERQVTNNIAKLVQEFEGKLNDVVLAKTTCVGQIAMPIWQPRMRTFPEELTIDDDGISLVSGVVLCTLGHVSPDFKMRKYPANENFPPVAKTGLEIDVAETVLPAWSDLIIAGQVNRFNVYDFTPKEYHQLADREFLQDVIPDLKKYGDEVEMNVDFRLRDPIRLRNLPPSDESQRIKDLPGNPLTLSLTSVPLYISMRKKDETKWTPVGELDLNIERDYSPYIQKLDFVRRGTKFAELSSFRIKSKWTFDAQYSAENTSVDEQRFVAAVLKAREAAQLLEGVKPESAFDLVMNGVPLRLDTLNWVNQHLVIQYELPGILLWNDSNESLTYEVRGPDKDWSAPLTLEPGEFDAKVAPYDLTWRRRTPTETQFFTLPMGKEFSYRNEDKPGLVIVNHDEQLEETRIIPQ